jgi:hypothetical protein
MMPHILFLFPSAARTPLPRQEVGRGGKLELDMKEHGGAEKEARMSTT